MIQSHRSRATALLLCFLAGAVGCSSDIDEDGDEASASGLFSLAVKLTSPTTGSTVSGTVPVTAVAGARVSWVNFYVDSQYAASSPPYTFAWDSTKVPDGMHTLSVTAKDARNRVVGTRSVRVNVVNAKASTSGAGSTGTSTPPTSTSTPADPKWGNAFFAPYAEMSHYPVPDLVQMSQPAGSR